MSGRNILFLAPLPPPINGQSLVSKILFNYLSRRHQIYLINLIKYSTNKGIFSFKRLFSVLYIFINIIKYAHKATTIYLTISESFLGNIKDIIIYILLFNKIDKLTIHLHGGSIDKVVFKRYKILKNINSFFYKRISAVIISGESHKYIFSMVNNRNIFIVPNFVQEKLFIDNSLSSKFKNIKKLKVLYLSTMDFKKGYWDLLLGIEKFIDLYPNTYEFNFAGEFRNKEERELFLNRIKLNSNIFYHGLVDDSKKKELLHAAHIFCLPTSYFEGQPISILEAYASGCVVLTTSKPGILDIFENKKNGYLIKEKSPISIKKNLINLEKNKFILESIAKNNLKIANKNYKQNKYCKKIETILN